MELGTNFSKSKKMARSSNETNKQVTGKPKRKRSVTPIPVSGKKSETSSGDDNKSIFKCSRCRQRGRLSCSQQACLKCCTDDTCEGHREQREAAIEKDLILEGKHYINNMAAQKRAKAIPPGKFRETSIKYTSETLTIWSLEQYLANPKWRDDAVRRSKRKAELLAKDRVNENLKRQMEGGRSTNKKKLKDNDESSTVSDAPMMKNGGLNRAQRFKNVMNDLYFKSLVSDA